MALRRSLAAAACTALLSIPTLAQAADDPDCRTIALLANPQGDLSKLGLQVRKDGLFDLTFSGKADVLTGAESCDLAGPADEFDVDCEWEAPSQAVALSKFNYLRVNLDLCLPAKLEAQDTAYSTGAYRVLRRMTASVEGEEEDDVYLETDISLDLVEYTPSGGSSQYSVTLEFSR